MQNYPRVEVTNSVIDWSWAASNDAQRAVIRLWGARVEAMGFGFDLGWGIELIKAASAETAHPISALFEDETGAMTVAVARGGEVEWSSTPEADDPTLRRLVEADVAELFPVTLRAADFALAGIDRVEVAHYFPGWALDEIVADAARRDRSVSATVQAAWQSAEPWVAAAESGAPLSRVTREAAPADASPMDRRRQTLIFPTEMLGTIEAQADRLDTSRSTLLVAAWALAR